MKDESSIPVRYYLACSYDNEKTSWETDIDIDTTNGLLEQLKALPPGIKAEINMLDGYGFYLFYNQKEYSWNNFTSDIPSQLRILAEKFNKLAGNGGKYFDCRFWG